MANKVGRPAKYNTEQELQDAIDLYFKNGVNTRTVVVGKGADRQEITLEVPTITGLCNYLGFESRQSFYDLEKHEMFSYSIKRARLFIEQYYEEMLMSGNVTGAIFALKNFGWIDKINTEHSGSIPVRVDFTEE